MRVCDQVWSADSRADISRDRDRPDAASSVYCKVDHLSGFFDCLRTGRNRIVLVSSESDRPITTEFLERSPPQVAHWFSTNIHATSDRLSAIPLGLANTYCGVTLKAPLISSGSRPFAGRPNWLYINFRTTSNPLAREPIKRHFWNLRSEDWISVQESTLSFEAYLEEMTSHRFVLCPPGNGADTHRLWEALYARTIPVVMDNPACHSFRDLPILFVEDFRLLSHDFLAREYERIKSSKWNWEKLFLPWWRNRIREECERLKGADARLLPRSKFLRAVAGAQLAELKRRILRKA